MATPEPKPRLCTICKLPRTAATGRQRTGCPNAVVIPIVRDTSDVPTSTINVQSVPVPLGQAPVGGAYPYAGNPYGLSILVADPCLPTPSRASSVKPTAAQLEEALLHAAAPLLNNHGNGGPAKVYDLARRVATPAADDPFQRAATAQWQLILAGRLDKAGRWVVTSREVAPSVPQYPAAVGYVNGTPGPNAPGFRGATPHPPGAMPMNIPAAPPAPPKAPVTSTQDHLTKLKFFFAVLLGTLLGIYMSM